MKVTLECVFEAKLESSLSRGCLAPLLVARHAKLVAALDLVKGSRFRV